MTDYALSYRCSECGREWTMLGDRPQTAMECPTCGVEVTSRGAEELAGPPTRVRLHLRECQQDLIWIDVEDGRIVDCAGGRCHHDIFVGREVGPEACRDTWRPGDIVLNRSENGFWEALRYPVESVEIIEIIDGRAT